ncbi:MAG: DNA mismatch repair endonuclease MutL [Prevotellaceae bacterium]|nr:DNA mismatch repair endonuclease MutL [Prevotellaceae bacterium]MDY4759681.1 DNA mismatch repair endonuclease MutL [Bacteroidaceae bacterium]PWL85093.1 MAG: DNA mismatch repair endonuclease MutL [Prevotellaceae bacterium]
MPDIIHLLPDSVANQIAAGEVIQRPASVVKELVENSIDAKATRIDVLITDAGKTCIQIVDNGCGMSETDARLAFERHATSKISKASDLFCLHTMGFRGEALPSIAAVSQVELRTKMSEEKLGVCLSIEGSKVVDQQPVACDVGANFMVKNLFFNIPARRRFLKSNQTEFNNIVAEFEKIVLAHPEVRFSLVNNDSVVYDLPSGTYLQRIADVFGKRMNQQLLHIEVDTSIVRIKGFVGTPESSRKKGAKQFFFVNGRYMRHPYFGRAVMLAYDRLIPPDEQVPYFVYFDIDPSRIDVNIHPTKAEIKFEDEQEVFQILMASVKEAVGKFDVAPQLDFGSSATPDEIPVYDPRKKSVEQPSITLEGGYNPFENSAPPRNSAPRNWQKLFDGISSHNEVSQEDIIPDVVEPKNPVLGRSLEHFQYKQRYIMTSVHSGLMVIDQHRAHVRILYERFLKNLSERKCAGERLIFPETVKLTPVESSALAASAGEIIAAGFDISDLGDGSFAINALPAGTETLNATELLKDVLAETDGKTGIKEEIDKHIALVLARHAAISVGSELGDKEMGGMIDELFATSSPKYTPDGKLVVAIIPQEKIEGLFS